jgi:hypothetical protein
MSHSLFHTKNFQTVILSKILIDMNLYVIKILITYLPKSRKNIFNYLLYQTCNIIKLILECQSLYMSSKMIWLLHMSMFNSFELIGSVIF